MGSENSENKEKTNVNFLGIYFSIDLFGRLKKNYYLCNEQNNVFYTHKIGVMNNILALTMSTPAQVAMQIAMRVKSRRLELDLTQKGLAERAGIKFATYRRFEQTGEISLTGLLQIGFALNALSDFDVLFSQKQYQSIDDVLDDSIVTRKRGKKK